MRIQYDGVGVPSWRRAPDLASPTGPSLGSDRDLNLPMGGHKSPQWVRHGCARKPHGTAPPCASSNGAQPPPGSPAFQPSLDVEQGPYSSKSLHAPRRPLRGNRIEPWGSRRRRHPLRYRDRVAFFGETGFSSERLGCCLSSTNEAANPTLASPSLEYPQFRATPTRIATGMVYCPWSPPRLQRI